MQTRRPLTLEEVARQAGVSKTTASVVLNGRADQVRISETTRARVIAVADRLGYVPDHAARSLRRRQTGIINILLWRLGSPFFSDIAAGVGEVAGPRDYQVSVIDVHDLDAELRAIRHLRQGSADGVIVAVNRRRVIGPAAERAAQADGAGPAGGGAAGSQPGPVDPVAASRRPRRRLPGHEASLDLGHRRVAHFTWEDVPLTAEEPDAGNARYRGYRRALARPASSPIRPGSRLARARRPAARSWPGGSSPAHPGPATRPTAVFATNDLIAFGAMRGFHEAGLRVPDDVALVGFHGVELSTLTIPSLTTVELRATELGRLGAEMLFSLLDGSPPAEPERVVPVQLVVRESCGALRR